MLKDVEKGDKHLLELLSERRFSSLKAELGSMREADIVDFFKDIPVQDRALVFRLLPKDLAIEVFEELPSDDQKLLLEAFSDEYIASIVDEMSPDDRAELFEEMPASITSKLMSLISASERAATARLLGYREDTAGRIMTPEYIRLRADMTAEDALKRIREVGLNKETVYYCYVTDRARKLLGVVTLRDLVIADSKTLISDLMTEDVVVAKTDDDQERVAELLARYDLLAVPVVDSEDRLVGIVTADDAADIIEEEATEDIQKLGAVEAIEIPYERAGVFFLWRKRVIWLMVLMITGLFTSTVIASYEELLETWVVLAFFIPVLIGSGGNAGSQASTLVVRSLATGGIELKDWLRILWKETRVGILLGLTLGLFIYLRSNFQIAGVEVGPMVGVVVGLTMFAVIFWANLVGTLLPIVLTKLKLDPAVASNPLVATLVDVIGLMVYFYIAIQILSI